MPNTAKQFYKKKRFSTYELPYQIQIRDNSTKPNQFTAFHGQSVGIVAVMQTMGGGFTTSQGHSDAVKLARKICRLLNKEEI